MPHMNPSPPESETIAGRELKYAADDDDLFSLSQHIMSCFPLASMAQKNPSSPNAAAIGPAEPYPNANGSRGRRRRMKMGAPSRRLWIGIPFLGFVCFGQKS
ncbi:hypothetical protein PanWU01x14_349120, partial [Parasponia andersonii]